MKRGHDGGGRDGEAAIFQVVEAIFVAILVASALLFFALVQKPTATSAGPGIDLARVSGDALATLRGDGTATSDLNASIEPLLEAGAANATAYANARAAVAGVLPDGLRFLLRATVFTATGSVTASVYGPTDLVTEPRNAQGAITYLADCDALVAANDCSPPGTDNPQPLVLVELVVWNAF